jgi:hypothetical protein
VGTLSSPLLYPCHDWEARQNQLSDFATPPVTFTAGAINLEHLS